MRSNIPVALIHLALWRSRIVEASDGLLLCSSPGIFSAWYVHSKRQDMTFINLYCLYSTSSQTCSSVCVPVIIKYISSLTTAFGSGVVVESFYYVFQMTGGAKEITREEMRAFKKVWAEFANPKTGYLERTNFVPFFGVRSLMFLPLTTILIFTL